MAYTPPTVGQILPAKQNTDVSNPGPVHSPYGNTEWLQAQAQNTAYENNLDLIEEWHNAERDNPPGAPYPIQLANKPSWAVLVAPAEAGGLDFQQHRIGPPVNSLT